jgi:predicted nucleic acid-binding protein
MKATMDHAGRLVIPPHRLSLQTTLTLLENNFLKLGTVVALNVKSYQRLLRAAPKNNVSGGRSYDAVIGACAEQAQVSALLTFNPGEFAALAQDYDIIVSGTK